MWKQDDEENNNREEPLLPDKSLTQANLTHEESKKGSILNETYISNYDDTETSINKKQIEKDKFKGHLYNLLSILGFFISNILTKVQYIVAPTITIELSQLYRSIVITILASMHIFYARKNLDFSVNLSNKLILFLNSLFSNVIYIFFFLACFYLRLGTANTLLYSYPLFSFLFACWFLNEKVRKIDIIGLFVGFFSILMILHFGVQVEKPFDDTDKESLLSTVNTSIYTTLLGTLFGALTAMSISAKSVICKKSAHVNINLHFLLFWMGILGILIGIGGMVITRGSLLLSLNIILVSVFIGVTTYYGNVYLLESFKYITLVESLVPGFITIILAFFIGKFTFNNSIDWMDITGSLILIIFNYFYIRHKVSCKEKDKDH